jgi:alginate O-acetyltransferase complex protein AlgI
MLFNSLAFIIFLPCVFIVYWLMPHKFRWVILLISSYYFYMSWDAKYIVLILSTTIISYAAARIIENQDNKNRKKSVLMISGLLCLSVLFVFKYSNFAHRFCLCTLKIQYLAVIQLSKVCCYAA